MNALKKHDLRTAASAVVLACAFTFPAMAQDAGTTATGDDSTSIAPQPEAEGVQPEIVEPVEAPIDPPETVDEADAAADALQAANDAAELAISAEAAANEALAGLATAMAALDKLQSAGAAADPAVQAEMVEKLAVLDGQVGQLAARFVDVLGSANESSDKIGDLRREMTDIRTALKQLCPDPENCTASAAEAGTDPDMELRIGDIEEAIVSLDNQSKEVNDRLAAIEGTQLALLEQLEAVLAGIAPGSPEPTVTDPVADPEDDMTPDPAAPEAGLYSMVTDNGALMRLAPRDVRALDIPLPDSTECASAGAWFLDNVEDYATPNFFVTEGARVRLCTYDNGRWQVFTAKAFKRAHVIRKGADG